MRISAKFDYACKAIVELAQHWPKKDPVQIKEISEVYQIPVRYLVNIMNQLKSIGIVESVRGPTGGYILKKDPADIKLGMVLKEIGGPLLPVANTIKKKETAFDGIWKEVENAMEKVLNNVTFEDICNKIKGTSDVIMYNI